VLAAVTRSPGEMVIEDVSGPGRARAGHVVVRPERVGICGSDFHLFSGDVGALSGARDEQVVVFGAGPIGLATLVAAVHQGARVMAVDPVASRRDLAKRLGAEVVAWAPPAELGDLARDWTNHEGPPLIVETSGEAGVLAHAVEMVPAAGRVVVVGMSSGKALVRPGAFPEKEIDVIGSSCATAADFTAAISLVAANRAAIAHVFSHHFPLARAAEAFAFALGRPADAVKIVVTVN
jgi:threonine dehydrogenase-like Zn-dependent dehydrogenase